MVTRHSVSVNRPGYWQCGERIESTPYDERGTEELCYYCGLPQASVHGACPWQSADEKERWSIVVAGWTVRDRRNKAYRRESSNPDRIRHPKRNIRRS